MDEMLDFTGKRILIFSDSHLGDKSLADNFGEAQQQKLELLIWNLSPDIIIINGDAFELWQFSYMDIWKAYVGLFQLLKNYNIIYVRGNHDWSVSEIKRFPFKIYDEFDFIHNGKKYHLEHGHKYDLFKKGWWKLFIPFVKFYGLIEKIILRKEFTILRLLKMQTKERDLDRYEKAADKILTTKEYDIVIFGHTHRFKEKKYYQLNKRYYNLGCWVSGKTDYLFLK